MAMSFMSLPGRSWPNAVQTFGMSKLFVAVPLTYAIAVVVLIRHFDHNDPAHQLSLGAVAVGIFYLHHAFSRADYVHLLEGIHGLHSGGGCVACHCRTQEFRIRPHAILTAGVLPPFLVWNAIHQPQFELLLSPPGASSLIDANGSTLSLPQPIASAVTALREIKASDLKAGETMLIAPHWPMAYALLRLRSPIWEIYHLFARPEAFQRAEIADLEHARVAFAIFSDPAIDGRNDRRMSTQEPIFYKYLTTMCRSKVPRCRRRTNSIVARRHFLPSRNPEFPRVKTLSKEIISALPAGRTQKRFASEPGI